MIIAMDITASPRRSAWLAASLLALATTVAHAAQPPQDCLHLSDGWVRLPRSEAMPMAAGFGVLRNDCTTQVVVQSVSSSAFGAASLHETTLSDGVSRMQELDQLSLAPGQQATLAPGGMHLMLMQARQPLREGQTLPLTLHLADGHEQQVELVVRRDAR